MSLFRLVGRALSLAHAADRRGFVVSALLQALGAASPAVLVLVGQHLVAEVTDGSLRVSSLVVPVILLALTSAIVTAIGAVQLQQQRLVGERVAAQTWRKILDVAGAVPFERFESPAFYDQLQRVKNNSLSQPLVMTGSVFSVIGSTVTALGMLVVVVAIAPVLVILLLLASIPTLLISRHTSRLEFAFMAKAMPVYRARQYLRDVLGSRQEIKEVRVFGAEPVLRRLHEDRQDSFDAALAGHVRRRTAYATLSVIASSSVLALTLGAVLYLLSTGHIQISQAAAAVLAVRFLASAFDQIFRSIGSLLESSTYLVDLENLTDSAVSQTPVSTTPLRPLRRAVHVSGVHFTYPGQSKPALRGVDLELRAGEVVALVGENGSGKTTLAKIIAGLYRPTLGSVTWDGDAYDDGDEARVHQHVAAIFQDFVKYQLSALHNVGLGDPPRMLDLAAARDAASRARALDMLDDLPMGFDTLLSKEFEGGTDLSEGQWQRVALARAIRKPASLIVLDEPSAALDPRAEFELFSDLRRILEDRSALLITHRFSSARLADRIYVLRDGMVVEQGDHQNLIEQDGLYAQLFSLQAASYNAS